MIKQCLLCNKRSFSFQIICENCAKNIIQKAIQEHGPHSFISVCSICGVTPCETPPEINNALLTVFVFKGGCKNCKKEEQIKPQFCLVINE